MYCIVTRVFTKSPGIATTGPLGEVLSKIFFSLTIHCLPAFPCESQNQRVVLSASLMNMTLCMYRLNIGFYPDVSDMTGLCMASERKTFQQNLWWFWWCPSQFGPSLDIWVTTLGFILYLHVKGVVWFQVGLVVGQLAVCTLLTTFWPGNAGNSLLNMPCQASHIPHGVTRTSWSSSKGPIVATVERNWYQGSLIDLNGGFTLQFKRLRVDIWISYNYRVSEAVDFAEVWFGPPAEGASGKWYDMMIMMLQWVCWLSLYPSIDPPVKVGSTFIALVYLPFYKLT